MTSILTTSNSQFFVRTPSGNTRSLSWPDFAQLLTCLNDIARRHGLSAIDGWAWWIIE